MSIKSFICPYLLLPLAVFFFFQNVNAQKIELSDKTLQMDNGFNDRPTNVPTQMDAFWAIKKANPQASVAHHPTNPDIFYTTINYGLMWRTEDGGKTYHQVSLAMDSVDAGFIFTPTKMYEARPDIILQARMQNVWRTTDGGKQWTIISDNPPAGTFSNNTALAIAPSNANIIVYAQLVVNDPDMPEVYKLNKTMDGGFTWKNVWDAAFPLARVTDIAIHPTQPNKMWVSFNIGYNATNSNRDKIIFYTDNGGTTWMNISDGLPPMPAFSIAVQKDSPVDAVYLATSVGVYYKDNTMARFVECQVDMPRGVR